MKDGVAMYLYSVLSMREKFDMDVMVVINFDSDGV